MSRSVSAVPREPAPPTAPPAADAARALALARDVLTTEALAITALAARLGAPFVAAVTLVLNCRGRVVVSGIGKSGHIARKLAATLASTGTPAFFVHPAEASHGDLGMITPDDVVVALSNSGETDELVLLMPHLKRAGARSSRSPATSSPRWRRPPTSISTRRSTRRPARWASRPRRAPPRRSRSVTRSRSRCSMRAASRSRTSHARTPAARSAGGC